MRSMNAGPESVALLESGRPSPVARSSRRAGGWILLSLLLASALPVSAQSFSVDWFTIDGGGGISTGGGFTLAGTAGQPDAGGPLTGGGFALTGGFWALAGGGAPDGVPALHILPRAPGFAQISWSPASPGFVLQVSDAPFGARWSDAPSGAANPVTVGTTAAAKFYRLRKP